MLLYIDAINIIDPNKSLITSLKKSLHCNRSKTWKAELLSRTQRKLLHKWHHLQATIHIRHSQRCRLSRMDATTNNTPTESPRERNHHKSNSMLAPHRSTLIPHVY